MRVSNSIRLGAQKVLLSLPLDTYVSSLRWNMWTCRQVNHGYATSFYWQIIWVARGAESMHTYVPYSVMTAELVRDKSTYGFLGEALTGVDIELGH